MRDRINLRGQIFGKWTVISRIEEYSGPSKWNCKCTCGAIRILSANHLRQGKTSQCRECYEKEVQPYPFSKLTEEQVRIARKMYKELGSYREVWRCFINIDYSTLRDAIAGRSWKHVTQ